MLQEVLRRQLADVSSFSQNSSSSLSTVDLRISPCIAAGAVQAVSYGTPGQVMELLDRATPEEIKSGGRAPNCTRVLAHVSFKSGAAGNLIEVSTGTILFAERGRASFRSLSCCAGDC